MTHPDLRDRLRELFKIGHHPLILLPERTRPVPDSSFQELTFSSGIGEEVRAFFATPNATSGAPAILYIHAHGNRYDIGAREVLDGRPALQGPMGQMLVNKGFAVFCIDLPGFGGRTDRTESDLTKAALWQGKSLAGQMVGELHAAFDWLIAQDGIDQTRVGAFGISMGATLGYWLAAAEPRVAALAQLCCFADFAELIRSGAHDLHGLYLTIPGLLNVASNGEIAGQIAPRPQFVGIGDQDPLTPAEAVDPALAELRAAYASCPDQLTIFRSKSTGHQETPEMRRAVFEFLKAL
ncbi:alpha/beta hydrolase family protein [Ruegeria hyattellae]|uniref:alpha/beta hydrolase family protein n=1 Tax=Ruegeria hyattellae TaxID=3233337 RepID=UPI00355BDEFF